MREVSLTIKLKIGESSEFGLGGFRQEWVSSEDGDGRKFDLSCGAGLGNSGLYATAKTADGSKAVYAQGSIVEMTTDLWQEMTKDLLAIYGACGVQDCTDCRPLFDANNEPIPGTESPDA